MRKSVRPLVIVAVFGLVLGGVGYAKPTLVSDLGLDFWNLSGLQTQLDRDLRVHRELDAKDVEVLRRIDFKETLILDLIGGRTTLPEVATHFKHLNVGRTEVMAAIRELVRRARFMTPASTP